MNIKLVLSFDGSNFSGWQLQPDKRTVSGEIIRAFKNIVSGDFKLVGCGRTDAGVHAINYVANVFVYGNLRVDFNKLRRTLNSMLPDDIFIKSANIVNDNFNARYSAKSKIYRYVFSTERNPLLRNRVFFIDDDINTVKVSDELKVFWGCHDFSGFSADERKNKICEIYSAHVCKVDSMFYFEVEGNRFLRKMLRFLACSVIMLNRGIISSGDILESLKTGKKLRNIEPLPAYALYLVDVKY